MDVLAHPAQLQTQDARERLPPAERVHLVRHEVRPLLRAPPHEPPQGLPRVAAAEGVLRVRDEHGGDPPAQRPLRPRRGAQPVQQLRPRPPRPDVLPEAGRGDVVAGDGDDVQAVPRRQVVAEHAVAGGRDEHGRAGVGKVEEERVEEGGQAVGGEHAAGGQGDAGREEVVDEARCRCREFRGALRIIIREI